MSAWCLRVRTGRADGRSQTTIVRSSPAVAIWPDFGRRDLFEAVHDFQNRERRFGRVSV